MVGQEFDRTPLYTMGVWCLKSGFDPRYSHLVADSTAEKTQRGHHGDCIHDQGGAEQRRDTW